MSWFNKKCSCCTEDAYTKNLLRKNDLDLDRLAEVLKIIIDSHEDLHYKITGKQAYLRLSLEQRGYKL